MEGNLGNNKTEFEVDIIGQLPSMRLYTQICSCFAMPDGVSDSKIIETLRKGLDKLSESFPWTAGQVVNEGACQGNTGTYKIAAYNKAPPLTVKDLRNEPGASSIESLRAAEFPMSSLHENVVAPRKTIPGSPEEAHLTDSPVLLFQATFIAGGFLLTVLGKHHVLDVRGQGQLMCLLSKACQGQAFTDDEMLVGNSIRADKIELLDDEAFATLRPAVDTTAAAPRSPPATTQPDPPAKMTWVNCIFEASSLAILKQEATDVLSEGYVSTDDVLCALIWKCITRVRQPGIAANATTTLCRAVDSRRYLNISPIYPGFIQTFVHPKFAVSEIVDKPIGHIAAALRACVEPKTCDVALQTRALATDISRSADRSKVSFVGVLDEQTDIFISSWAGEPMYNLDFGLGLGRPEAVRRPYLRHVAGLNYILPKRPDGQLTVAMCLKDDDLNKLKADLEFSRFGRFAGEIDD